jgi:hypothetical protein
MNMDLDEDDRDDDLMEVEYDADKAPGAVQDGDKAPAEGNDSGDDATGSDERLSGDLRDGDETDEQRRDRRRQEKQDKKKNRRTYERDERLLMAAMSDQLRQATERLAQLEGKITSDDHAAIAQQAEYWTRQAERIARARAKAVNEGDGELFARADNDYADALARANYYKNATRSPAKPEKQGPGMSPQAAAFATQFAENNPWYDGENRPSRVVNQIDAAMLRQGWSPDDPAYWEKLEEEARKRLPELFEDDEPAPRRDQRTSPQDRARRGPPVGGKTNGQSPETRPGTVRISKEFRATLEAAGMWDDKAVRDRAIREHLRIKNEQRR